MRDDRSNYGITESIWNVYSGAYLKILIAQSKNNTFFDSIRLLLSIDLSIYLFVRLLG